MAKAEWGTKRSCQSCGTKFYDLRKPRIVCPKCGTELDPQVLARPQRARPAPVPVPKPVEAEIEDVEVEIEEGALEAEAEEEEEVIEDASELGGDKDDMFEVIEKPEGEDER